MPLLMKPNKTTNPPDIGLLGPPTVVPNTNRFSDALQEPRWRTGHRRRVVTHHVASHVPEYDATCRHRRDILIVAALDTAVGTDRGHAFDGVFATMRRRFSPPLTTSATRPAMLYSHDR